MIRVVAGAVAALAALTIPQPAAPPIRGLTGAAEIARAFDAILDADLESLPTRLTTTCATAPHEVCQTLEAVGLWWGIALEPESRMLDVRFSSAVDAAIAASAAWTTREPSRAEA